MSRSAGADNLSPFAAGQAQDAAAHGVEYTAEFQELDALVNAYDAEGVGPLRKGERPFQWEQVATAAQALLARAPDLRVAVWLLRAWLEQSGVSGLLAGLACIVELLALPEAVLHPRPQEGEPAREAHAISLAWLGSASLLHQVRQAPFSPTIALSCGALRHDTNQAQALAPAARTELLERLQGGLQHLEHITEVLQQSQTEPAFNTAHLYEELAFAFKTLGASTAPQGMGSKPAAEPARHVQAQAAGPVFQKREEVLHTLSGLIAYFREHEPGHPAPLLLQRVQRMVGASFETILAELYADAEQLVARVEKPQAH